MSSKTIVANQLAKALDEMGYHKTKDFIHRCQVEANGKRIFTKDIVESVSFQMLDRDLEKELLRKINF